MCYGESVSIKIPRWLQSEKISLLMWELVTDDKYDKYVRLVINREWNNIDVLIIIDDVKLNNLELYVYKELFLKVYSYNFNEHCKKVFIYSK